MLSHWKSFSRSASIFHPLLLKFPLLCLHGACAWLHCLSTANKSHSSGALLYLPCLTSSLLDVVGFGCEDQDVSLCVSSLRESDFACCDCEVIWLRFANCPLRGHFGSSANPQVTSLTALSSKWWTAFSRNVNSISQKLLQIRKQMVGDEYTNIRQIFSFLSGTLLDIFQLATGHCPE